jgi:catechol 2,3-dioxygenase-like lactoylglutathione lyase family enzyme
VRPRLFRVILQVGDLDAARAFYTELLGVDGRMVGGGRCYFDCGDVILALLDPSAEHASPRPNVENVYFAVDDLEALHARAARLEGLSAGSVHGERAGAIETRPWGERSFYARDPWGNLLCFVDAATRFTGR